MSAVKQYSAGRDFLSAAKMNYFHHVLKQITGWTLHPRVEISANKPCRIGDMGTQTAIWAIDVAEDTKMDSAVHAFDISTKFFPPGAWLPRNLTLHVQDIELQFPDEHLGCFDVVHFRLFITLTTERLASMIQNAITLLKPGGYIQWVEHDKTCLKPITADGGQDTSVMEALIELQQNPFPNYNAAWVKEIGSTMATQGLEVLVEESIQTRPSVLTQMNELHLIALMDVPAGLSKSVDQFKEIHFERMAEDSYKGVAVIDSFMAVVARKPPNNFQL